VRKALQDKGKKVPTCGFDLPSRSGLDQNVLSLCYAELVRSLRLFKALKSLKSLNGRMVKSLKSPSSQLVNSSISQVGGDKQAV
jgi:hypothetical protein